MNAIESLFDALFYPEQEKRYPWLRYGWILALFLFGVYLWGKFLSWNTLLLDFYDWGKLNTPRLLFLQNAFKAGELPLHLSSPAALLGLTDRFFSIPDVITTPQTLLLMVVDIPTFIVIDILIYYALGFIGLLWFRRRVGLSLFAFTVLFFLFMFNGHVLAHYSVGHLNWDAYFLFPVIFMYLIRFLDGDKGWRWVAGFSFAIFWMALSGGWHQILWIYMFVGILLLSCRERLWLIAGCVFSAFLSAIRFLPPALELQTFTEIKTFKMVLGYPALAEVLESMLFIRRPVLAPAEYAQFNLYGYEKFYWEFNFYLGVIGTLFLVIFGIYFWFKNQKPQYRELIVPAIVLVAFSIGSTFWLVRLSGIPFVSGERVTSRIISLPIVLFMMMSVSHFQQWMDQKRFLSWHRVIFSSALILFSLDLYNNLRVWRFSESANYFGDNMIDLAGSAVANHPDPAYFTILGIGLVITTITALLLFFLSLREKQAQAKK
ncbi:MAG: hypothetical protein ACOYYU_08535 [Chloroflexota bacterium]